MLSRKRVTLASILALGLCGVIAAAGPPTYRLNALIFTPSWVDNQGRILGFTSDGFAVEDRNETTRQLGDPSAFPFASADNPGGQIVGQALINGRFVAAQYVDGTWVPLGSLPGERFGFASSINASGMVVGGSFGPGSVRLVTYSGGSATAIDLGPGSGILAIAGPFITDDQRIIGTLFDRNVGADRGFVYDLKTGGLTTFQPLAGDTHTWAMGVNHSGEVLGYSFISGSTEHIGVWDKRGQFTTYFTEGTPDYPTVSNSLVFNDRDQIVISATTDGNTYLVPSVGTRINLNSLVPDLPTDSFVIGINNRGWIVGSGFDPTTFQEIDFLLTPAS
jgi:hypothetical protein